MTANFKRFLRMGQRLAANPQITFGRIGCILFLVCLASCESRDSRKIIGRPVARFEGNCAIVFSPDGNYFFSGRQLRDTSNWEVVFELPTTDERVMWASFSNDSQVLSILLSGVVTIVDVPTRKVICDRAVNGAIAASYFPETQTIFTIDSSGTVRRWSKDVVPTTAASMIGSPLEVLKPDLKRDTIDFEGVDISESTHLAAVANETQIKFFKTDKLEEVSTVDIDLPLMAIPRNVVKISSDGRKAAFTNGSDARIAKLDNSSKQIKIFTYPKGPIVALGWCLEDTILAAVCHSHNSGNLCIQFFDAETGDTLGIVPVHGHPSSRYGRMASSKGKLLATCGSNNATSRSDQIVKIWDIESLLKVTLRNNPPTYQEQFIAN